MTFATPQEAEEAFYNAFERGDSSAVMDVWADDADIMCIHPGGTCLRGVAEVRESWRQILEAPTEWTFRLSDRHCTIDDRLAIHVLRENIEIDGVLHGVMLATNVYQFMDGSWRMILHHASPDPGVAAEFERDATVH